ncbi:MAG: sigma-70 family RNA polymerase sigma factor, partial [Acidimicrobiales bacterium]
MTFRRAHATLTDLTDLELVDRFQRGCPDALPVVIARYRRFTRAKARRYFLVGADRDDVEQETLIGLYKAARDFRPDHQSSFRAFAELCITRQVITAIKTATRQKHRALNQYVSISGLPAGDEAAKRAVEALVHVDRRCDDPADRLVAAERFGAMKDRLAEVLSDLEVDVLALYA